MKNSLRFTTALMVATLIAHPMSAAIYMKIEGVKGRVTAAQYRDYVEIGSLSFGAAPASANPNTVQGNFIGTDAACASGRVTFTVRDQPSRADMAKLCQARGRVTSLVVVLNNQEHTLQNAAFESCQSGDSVPMDQFSMNFAKCSTHSAAPAREVAPNGKLIGLTPTPIAVHMERLSLSGTGATMTITKRGSARLIYPSTELPTLVVELDNGQKWTFYRIVLKDAVITSAAPRADDRPTESFSMNFTKVEGPPAGFQELSGTR